LPIASFILDDTPARAPARVAGRVGWEPTTKLTGSRTGFCVKEWGWTTPVLVGEDGFRQRAPALAMLAGREGDVPEVSQGDAA
jgi:hypothetical protein